MQARVEHYLLVYFIYLTQLPDHKLSTACQGMLKGRSKVYISERSTFVLFDVAKHDIIVMAF